MHASCRSDSIDMVLLCPAGILREYLSHTIICQFQNRAVLPGFVRYLTVNSRNTGPTGCAVAGCSLYTAHRWSDQVHKNESARE